jgi:tricarballylate dehydrogenase
MELKMNEVIDVVVVGGGNAGFTAALAAAERGREVILLEKAEMDTSGGNSYYTAGATRIPHQGLDDLLDVVEPDQRHSVTVVPPYTAHEYLTDLDKVSEGRNDSELSRVLVQESHTTLRWLQRHGLKYRLMYERQAYTQPDGSYLFWGGLHVGNVGGGKGLMADHREVAKRAGVTVRYGHAATGLTKDGSKVSGVSFRTTDGQTGHLRAQSVILASGGFEANPEMRRQHLGEGWQNAKVRGTPGNTGEMIMAALDAGAARGGDWATCHSVAWDALHPKNESNFQLTNQLTRGGYPLGIVVNRLGKRFVDEGADFRNYTYAKYGRDILAQPGSIAFQIFDASTRAMLRTEEYDMLGASEITADSITELALKAGIQPELEETIRSFNASIDATKAFDPNVKDHRKADAAPPKSNWALAIESGPFYAFPVTCGVTFTFGGLKTDTEGRVLTAEGSPLPGLYACGEALGGLFSGNYPGGSGLAAGAVFGRRAGTIA